MNLAIAGARQHIERLERQLAALQYSGSDAPVKHESILHELNRWNWRREQLRLAQECLQERSGLPGSSTRIVVLFAVSDTPASNLIAESVNSRPSSNCCPYGKHFSNTAWPKLILTLVFHDSADGKQF